MTGERNLGTIRMRRPNHWCLIIFYSLEQKMGHKKMFNGSEFNQRRSDKQNFGFLANGGSGAAAAQRNGNAGAVISVRFAILLFHAKQQKLFRIYLFKTICDHCFHRFAELLVPRRGGAEEEGGRV